jgi:integral membrane protein (TIGR01906 family)
MAASQAGQPLSVLMNQSATFLKSAAEWLVTLLLPFALVLTAVRLLMTPAWIHIEYRTPGFPDDPFGFSREDRLKWSIISLDYLLNDAGIESMEVHRLDSGAPLYNEREIRHLVDTKNIVQGVLVVWWVTLIGVIALGVAARVWDFGPAFRRGLRRGSWGTIGLVAAILLFVLVAFGIFFVYFHEVFFDPGTWTFLTSDTFIRLFPERFWRDAFLWIGGITIIEALWLISLTRPREKETAPKNGPS